MGLDAIDTNVSRTLETVRLSVTPPVAKRETPEGPTTEKSAVSPAAPERSAPSGVPRRIAVPQQLPPNTRLYVDKENNRVVAQVLDENNEVVRQIPPEALLELSDRINRLEGLLFNQEL